MFPSANVNRVILVPAFFQLSEHTSLNFKSLFTQELTPHWKASSLSLSLSLCWSLNLSSSFITIHWANHYQQPRLCANPMRCMSDSMLSHEDWYSTRNTWSYSEDGLFISTFSYGSMHTDYGDVGHQKILVKKGRSWMEKTPQKYKTAIQQSNAEPPNLRCHMETSLPSYYPRSFNSLSLT